MAGDDVSFLGAVSDEGVRDQYREAAMVLLPGEEDFGIVPVEAQACGRPVIALGSGGVLDTVVPLGNASDLPPTGIFFDEATSALDSDSEAAIQAAPGIGRPTKRFDSTVVICTLKRARRRAPQTT